MFKLSLALWCGIIGSFFTFPGLRYARMHKDALKYCSERPFLKYGFYIVFAFLILEICLLFNKQDSYFYEPTRKVSKTEIFVNRD